MAKLGSFGELPAEDDTIEVQGVEYPVNPVGLRAMRKLITVQKSIERRGPNSDVLDEEELNLAEEIVLSAVRSDFRQKFHDHIEESVSPALLIQIATFVMGTFSDLDPTQPESSSGGSTSTGSASTVGVPAVASTPSI